jgi:hypothetical protein
MNSEGAHLLGPATDSTTPIYQVVNDTGLREKVLNDWVPEEDW